jgi:lysophospholipase L1-like esterase
VKACRRTAALVVLALVGLLVPQRTVPLPAGPFVLGLGDSVMSGTHCRCAGIAAGYAAALSQSTGVHHVGLDLSEPGSTTEDLLDQLRTDAATRRAVAEAEVVVIISGANDLSGLAPVSERDGPRACYRPEVTALGRRLGEALAVISQLHGPTPQHILVLNYWNVYLDGAVAARSESPAFIAWSKQVTADTNAEICRQAHHHAARCVDIHARFEASGDPTRLLADDGDHPNAAGVTLIVSAMPLPRPS